MFDDFFGGGGGGGGGRRAKPPQDLYPKGSKVGKLSEAKFPKKGSAHVWLVRGGRLLTINAVVSLLLMVSSVIVRCYFCSATPPLSHPDLFAWFGALSRVLAGVDVVAKGS